MSHLMILLRVIITTHLSHRSHLKPVAAYKAFQHTSYYCTYHLQANFHGISSVLEHRFGMA